MNCRRFCLRFAAAAILSLAGGCTTLGTLKNDMAEKPPRRQERKEEAVAAFEAHRQAAQLQAALDRFREGNEAACYTQLAELVEQYPQNGDARLQLAELHLLRGELAPAEEQIRAALALSPQRAELHDCLGRILEASSRSDESAAAFAQAEHLEPALASSLR